MTATMVPTTIVPAPPRNPFDFGLFSQVTFRDGAGDRWNNGVTWQGAPCTDVHGLGDRGCDSPLSLTIDGAPTGGDGDPFTVYGHFKCSPIGMTVAEGEQYALDNLLQGEERRVEQALWSGDLGNTPNLTGQNGYPAPTDLGATTDSAVALARLEAWLATVAGAAGVFHMGRGTASYLVSKGRLEARGGRLFTRLGTAVIAGSGYVDGTVVATGALAGYRSEPFTSTDRPGDLLDRAKNDLSALAQREYVLIVDGCGMAKVAYDYDPVEGGKD